MEDDLTTIIRPRACVKHLVCASCSWNKFKQSVLFFFEVKFRFTRMHTIYSCSSASIAALKLCRESKQADKMAHPPTSHFQRPAGMLLSLSSFLSREPPPPPLPPTPTHAQSVNFIEGKLQIVSRPARVCVFSWHHRLCAPLAQHCSANRCTKLCLLTTARDAILKIKHMWEVIY